MNVKMAFSWNQICQHWAHIATAKALKWNHLNFSVENIHA